MTDLDPSAWTPAYDDEMMIIIGDEHWTLIIYPFMIRTYFSHRRYFLSQFFVLMGIICIASVLISRESRNRAGGDTLWIIDNSLSMGVEDMRGDQGDTIESRLDAAKSLILSGSASM